MNRRAPFLTLPLLLASFTLLLFIWLLTPHAAQAATHTVGGRCGQTIQACINSVADGDTILIPAGTWNESVTLDRPVSLTGVSSATTLIKALPGQRVITVTGANIDNLTSIANVTLANGDISAGNVCFPSPTNCGGGMLITGGARPFLANLILENNQAYRGGGLYTDAGSVISMSQLVFSNNVSVLSGGGANLGDAATISGTQFLNNRSTNNVAGGLRAGGDTVVVNTVFRGNEADCPSAFSICHAGGLYGFEVNLMVSDSLFENNRCNGADCDGGGLYLSSSFVTNTLSLTNTDFISNTAGRHGGGAYVPSFRSFTTVDRGRFERNRATLGDGGGLNSYRIVLTGTQFLTNSTGATGTFDEGGGGLNVNTTAVLTNAFFSGNHSERGGGGLAVFLGPVTLNNSRFVGNSAQENGGGAYVELAGATVTDTLFENNRTLAPEIINDDNVGNGGGLWLNGDTTLSNVTLSHNLATNRGGGLYMPSGAAATLTVSNAVIQGNEALGTEFFGDGGGGINLSNHALIANNTRFLNNEALPAGGGGLYSVGPITIGNGLFEGNQALFGGGMYASTTASFSGTQFVGNSAVNTGGGAMTGGSAVFTDVLFQQNSSTGVNPGQGSGGGLRASEPITLTNAQFISNTAVGSSGGGIAAFTAIALTNTLFQGNSSGGSGGGLAASFDPIWMTNTRFISNSAALNGGGMQSSGNISLIAGLFQRNHSANFGGGLYTSGSVGITSTVVTSNTADSDGGGLYVNSNLQAYDSLVAGNVSGGNGGGIYEGSLTTRFLDNVIRGNQAQGDGGGMYVRFRMEADGGNRFEGNSAQGAGGGLYVGRQWLVLSDTLFIDNQADIGGGLIITTTFAGTTGSRLVNVLFGGNTATTDGAAIYYNSTRPLDLYHATVADDGFNTQEAIDVRNGLVTITNTIFASHTVAIANNGGTVNANANLYYGNGITQTGIISGNGGNVSGDPLFLNPAADDYHISPGAAVNSGLDAGIGTDFEGDNRPVGAGFDIGFDELSLDLALSKTVFPTGPVQPGAAITYTLQFTNAGSNLAQNVRISDSVPVSLTNVSFLNSGAAITQTNVGVLTYTWDVANLAPGAGGLIYISGVVSPDLSLDTTFTNTALIGSGLTDTDTNNNQAQAAIDVVVPRLAFESAGSSINEGVGTAVITVTLDRMPLADVTVVYATTAGTATAGGDYIAASSTLTIPAGFIAATFAVTILEDAIAEPTEDLRLSLSAPQGALLDALDEATLTIVDNDAAAVIVNPTSVAVTEGRVTDTVTVTLTSEPADAVFISLSTAGQAFVTPTLLMFTALDWNQPQRVTVGADYDAVREGSHTDLITQTASSSDPFYDGVIISHVTVSITDQVRLFVPVAVNLSGATAAQPAGGGENRPVGSWVAKMFVDPLTIWLRGLLTAAME